MARTLFRFGWVLAACMAVLSPASATDRQLPLHALVLDHWSAEQGLPQITVLGLAQDRAGFLWVATQSAVARFDGEGFTSFDRAATGVDTTMLTAIWADPAGGVWFGGPQGLLHESDGLFSALGGKQVNAIVDAGDGMPLLATATGLARLHDGRIVPVAGYEGEATSLLRVGGTVWVGGFGRVCRFEPVDAQPVFTCFVTSGSEGRADAITQLAYTAESLWLGSHAGLRRLVGGRIVDAGLGASLATTRIEALLADHAGSLWIGTAPALYRRMPDGALERAADQVIASKPWVQSLLEDDSGNLWLGTHTRGMYRVWNGWTRRVSTADGLSDALVWSVLRDSDGQLLIGTNSGIEKFDGQRVRPFIGGAELTDPSAHELYRDSRRRLWVGTRAGVSVFDGTRNVTPPALAALDRWQINDVLEVAADDLWIATSSGLYRWYAGVLTRLDPASQGSASIIRTIHVTASGLIQIGTGGGVREWHDGRLVWPAWAAALRGRFITRLATLGPGLLGIATNDAGIGVMRDGQLRMVGRKDGLPSDNAWTLDVLGDELYVGSNDGAWRLPLAQLPRPGEPARKLHPQIIAGEVRATSVQRSPCCNGGAGSRSLVVGDAIWFATTDGALRVDTGKLHWPQPPAAMIESVEHDGRQFHGSRFDLREGARDVAIHFTAPYLRMGSVAFRYQLEGYDTQWQNALARRTAFYTHLPPGDYVFRVEARVAGSAASGRAGQLAIHVRPFWYERIAVRVAAILLGLLGLYLLLGWRARQQRRRNVKLEAQVAQRTEQLAEAFERLRVTNLALAEASQTDSLTSLHNRRYLLSRLPELLSGDDSVGVVQIDLDYFKHINDTYGHAVGDDVLRSVARLLAAARRDGDVTARWGGEEFLLLLRQVDAAQVLQVAERLRLELAAYPFADGRGGTIQLTCSIGFSLHPLAADADSSAFAAVLELADLALYQAKADGRNHCVGLLAVHDLPADVLRSPFAPQLAALLSRSQLSWLRKTS